MTQGVASTRGHCAGNGGLRGHSVGSMFPYMIVLCGHPDAVTYQVWGPGGFRSRQFGSWDEAGKLAHQLKEADEDV